MQVDVLRQAGLQVDVVLPPNFESDVSLCIDGAATFLQTLKAMWACALMVLPPSQ